MFRKSRKIADFDSAHLNIGSKSVKIWKVIENKG